MDASSIGIFSVIAIGTMMGVSVGLGVGYFLGTQKPIWNDMNLKEKIINFVLLAICSLLAIAGLALYFLK
ncbi:MAG: hypothetical protein ABR887_00805 [Methanoregulaceae archaeon]|jgi:uncharacterized membrane protein